jgi:hypothetical protein
MSDESNTLFSAASLAIAANAADIHDALGQLHAEACDLLQALNARCPVSEWKWGWEDENDGGEDDYEDARRKAYPFGTTKMQRYRYVYNDKKKRDAYAAFGVGSVSEPLRTYAFFTELVQESMLDDTFRRIALEVGETAGLRLSLMPRGALVLMRPSVALAELDLQRAAEEVNALLTLWEQFRSAASTPGKGERGKGKPKRGRK